MVDNLIITWSAKRAHKDSMDRQRHIRKAQKAIDTKTRLNSNKMLYVMATMECNVVKRN